MSEGEHQHDKPAPEPMEQLDYDALRKAYSQPSRWELRRDRIKRGLRPLGNSTLWTVLLALAIVGVLVAGYLAIT